MFVIPTNLTVSQQAATAISMLGIIFESYDISVFRPENLDIGEEWKAWALLGKSAAYVGENEDLRRLFGGVEGYLKTFWGNTPIEWGNYNGLQGYNDFPGPVEALYLRNGARARVRAAISENLVRSGLAVVKP